MQYPDARLQEMRRRIRRRIHREELRQLWAGRLLTTVGFLTVTGAAVWLIVTYGPY